MESEGKIIQVKSSIKPKVLPRVVSSRVPKKIEETTEEAEKTSMNTDAILSSPASPLFSKKVSPRAKIALASGAISKDLVSNYIESTDSIDIDLFLKENKYTVITRYIMSEKVDYIKAISPLGDIVFINVDQKGISTTDVGDFTSVSQVAGTKISVSDRLSATDCTSTSTCGVALQCADELCTILRRDDGSNSQKSFVMTEGYSSKTITPDGSSIAYPIVKLSEIKINPKLTVQRISMASQKIYDNSFSISSLDVEATMKEMSKICTVGTDFMQKRVKYINFYAGDIIRLQELAKKYYDRFLEGGITSEANKESYLYILINLYARHKLMCEINKVSSIFSQIQQDLVQTRSRMESLIDIMSQEYENTLDSSKKSRILTADEVFAMGEK
jgi:hypothetical protein